MRWILLALLLAPIPASAQAVVVSACGAKTFTVGSTNYVTMNPQGYLCVSTTTTVVVTTAREPAQAEQPMIEGEPKPK
jgi:hypothetical protein